MLLGLYYSIFETELSWSQKLWIVLGLAVFQITKDRTRFLYNY